MSANRAITFDVALHDGDPVRYPVHAELFLPEGPAPDSVQVLISGLTYDSRYWTLPGANDYVAHQVRAGHAVLALDRIGTGRSGRPPATEVTVDGNLAALHQVITALRAGHAGLPAFRRVIVVGHSLGSGLALLEAAEHRDVDGVVVTGLQHRFGPLHDEVAGGLHPAALDPAFEADTAPEGYLTTQPGRRADFYEHPGAVTPELSKWHEETKSTVTLGEGGTLQRIYDPAVPAGVEVPVMLVVGAEDRIFGGGDAATVLAHERPLYAPAARLEVFVLPAAGHALNVHANAAEWFTAAGAWIDGILR
ncbi:alpha/beta fold hydrolase [Actinoplanes hulinensis]|uniref:Alpha/beta fold hydrolase n=1 Tax=Actinoplanes hulinensis TaxID=1144547 RepID=A0ABS7B7R6_9ACTN|nr:alpha/beta fold hydrolase [Actinoplanes hulinensis]MBW6437066.1 alpha/beta fold hydrolase [Actinoplanes hulinensis]